MMISGLLLVPFAYYMTDLSKEISWGFSGPYIAAIIQVLNAIDALMLVYAIQFGKVIIVAPLTNAVAPTYYHYPVADDYAVIPNPVIVAGMVIAMIAVYLIAD